MSVDREMFALPADFLVIATQNPREFEGTYPLPESQLDRFMLRLELSYPALDAETEVLMRYTGVAAEPAPPVSSPVPPVWCRRRERPPSRCIFPRSCVPMCWRSPRLRANTRSCPWGCRRAARWRCCVRRASSPASAGREFVTADDVKAVAPMVLPHRLMLTGDALLADVTESDVVARILEQVPAPR